MTEPQQETWRKLAVLTVIALAAVTGISAFKSSGYATRVQIYAAREAQQWQNYQVKSIEKDNFGLKRDILVTLKPSEDKTTKHQKSLATRIKECEEEMGRLNLERDHFKKEAQILAAQEEALAQKAGELGLAVILFQLSIMSSAAGALTRKKLLWQMGLCLSLCGLTYMIKNLVF